MIRRLRRLLGLVAVMSIFVLLVMLASPRMPICTIDTKAVVARVQINRFESALTQYKLDTGTFPATDQGLEALRPYLTKEIPLDPWGHRYVYKFPGEHGNQPDIVSHGADGRDIVSWKN